MSIQNTRLGAKKIGELLRESKKIFFVGIGGISMSSLAHISHEQGEEVGGSDRSESALTRMLEQEGVKISYTHDERNVEGYDLLVSYLVVHYDVSCGGSGDVLLVEFLFVLLGIVFLACKLIHIP